MPKIEDKARKAYDRFRECIRKEDYPSAYKIFRKQPNLTDYMRIADIPDIYTTMVGVGHREALQFRAALRESMQNAERRMYTTEGIETILKHARRGKDGKIILRLPKPDSEFGKKLRESVLKEFEMYRASR